MEERVAAERNGSVPLTADILACSAAPPTSIYLSAYLNRIVSD